MESIRLKVSKKTETGKKIAELEDRRKSEYYLMKGE